MGDGPERVIRVSSKPVDDGIEIAVSDTGIGISAEDAARVFYAFRRGSNHQGVAGKGVGLAGVKAIIETYEAVGCLKFLSFYCSRVRARSQPPPAHCRLRAAAGSAHFGGGR